MRIGDTVRIKTEKTRSDWGSAVSTLGIVRGFTERYALLEMLDSNLKPIYKSCVFLEDIAGVVK